MISPSLCPRCRQLVPTADASGSCPACGHEIDTAARPGTVLATPTPVLASIGPHATATPARLTPATGKCGTARAVPFGSVPPVLPVTPDIPNHTDFELLGRGGMGTVYRAVQRPTDRTVAVKVVHYPSADAALRERFVSEVRAHARVQHAGLVAIYEVGECSHGPYFTMEYHPGGTLADRLRAGELAVEEAVRIAADAADAVQAAHDAGVLHRDLKPSNILLGRDGRVKVTDFGLAKHADAAEQTRTGVLLGTFAYMSPEQAAGDVRRVTKLSDVYGLGATLYQGLTGRPPHDYPDQTPQQALRAVRANPTPAPGAVRPDLCETLNAIVTKAMAGRPADRYASAQAFAADLRRWLANEPTEARPLSRTERSGRWARRHATALAAGLVLFLVAAGIAQGVRESDGRRQREQALARGEPVTLVPPVGLPPIVSWDAGNAELSTTLIGDGSAGFQTQVRSLLRLVDDPACDHYRVTFDLRHAARPAVVPSFVGCYFGYVDGRADDGTPFQHYHVVKFADFWGADEAVDPQAAATHAVLPQNYVVFRRGDQDEPHAVDMWITNPQAFRFPAAHNAPARNVWRTVVLEVHPDRVKVGWRAADGPVVWGVARADRLNQQATRPELLRTTPSGRPILPPPFNPRSPLGIYATEAAVAFRNVTLEPLPDDRGGAPLP